MENVNMPIVIRYNNDLEFRRQVAFNRMYHSANVKRRVTIELVIMAVSAVIAAALWFSGTSMKYSTYLLYLFLIIAVVFLARYLRAVLVRSRIKPSDPKRAEREFMFDESGFSFGPINDSGELMMTRWGDVDRVYITEGVMYLLCMSRKHWAAIDKRLIVEGDWDSLIALVRKNTPRFKIYDLTKKGLVK